jgi:hypothetical protein
VFEAPRERVWREWTEPERGDGRTEMVMSQTGGGLTPEGYERAAQGWGGFFDRLGERLAAD